MHAIRARRLAAVAWTLAALSGCGSTSEPTPECTQASACGAVANGTAACVNGACAIGACNGGFADCDGQRADGCEVDTSSSLAHCGACNQACAPQNAAGTCAAGQCQIAACGGAFLDCDGSAANGCEVDPATSLAHCGACNQACAPANATGVCIYGQCAVYACTPPFSDCDGDPANGCECVLRAASGMTVFNQTVPEQDGDGVVFPGQANFWDIDGDFSLRSGGDRQFAGGLVLKVGALDAAAEYFPGDQVYSELAFFRPEFTAADGIRVAAVSGPFTYVGGQARAPLSGSYSAWLASTSASEISQEVDLSGVPAGTSVTLSWQDAGFPTAALIPGRPPSSYLVRAVTGGIPSVIAQPGLDGGWPATPHAIEIGSLAGNRVTISFEFRGQSIGMLAVDDVSVAAGGPNLVQNGGFETGDFTGWTLNAPAESQNMASGPRDLGGLRVTRTVFAPPAALWARWLDVYENAGAADVVTTAWYETALGSAGNGVTYFVDGSGGLAVSSWDTCSAAPACAPGTRDVGLAFGAASGVAFATAPDLSGNNWALSDLVSWRFPLVVPAGGRVALVHFVVMDGADTGTTIPASLANRAAAVDAQNLAIATGFWSDPRYRAGMTQAQIDAVANWPRECVQAADCPALPHGTPACVSGACAVGACDAGFDDCNGFPGDGCEAALATDVAHCGACGAACPAVVNGTPGCAAGACGVGSCFQPWGDCDGGAGNGCETDTGASLAHCGACNASCAPPNATGVCAAGSCGVGSCTGAFEDCDGLPGNGCERDLTSDVDHCGLCTLACSMPNATPACVGGLCAIAACDAPFADCVNGAADGCETNTSIDLASCGGCNLACGFPNATAACLNGICSFAGCLLPYASCNGIEADGCEVDTSSDPLHCGTCAPCPAVANGAAGCTSGVCGIASCDAGYADCNGLSADGCETSPLTDPSSCGGCGVVCAGGVCSGGACAPVITAVSPAWGSVEGGEMVLVTGADFTGATSAVVGGFTVAATVGGGGTTLAFVSPAHARGAADVVVTNGAGRTATATGAFEYLLALAPGRTIAVDGQAGDWTGDYRVATEATATDWAGNALRALSVAFDATHLYLGIDGETALASGNALIAYLDRDAGVGTGAADLGALLDDAGFLDDACSGTLNASGVAGFGAEFCLGTVDMTSVAVGGGMAGTDSAGLRDVATDPANFAWAVDGAGSLVAVAAPGGLGAWVEIAVPWTSIYGAGGLPAGGPELSLFVRIAGLGGTAHANQSLPSQGGATVETVTAVFTFRAR